MRVRHPRAGEGPGVPPSAVDVNGRTVPLDDDGTFETDSESWLQQFANANDVDAEDILIDETEQLVGSFDPNEHTVDEIEEHVSSINGSDIVAELEAIRAAEAAGEGRTTALEVIDARLNDLED